MVLTLSKQKKQTDQNFQTLTAPKRYKASFKRKGKSKKIQADYANGIRRFHPTHFYFNHHISIFEGQAQFRNV